MKKCEYCGRQSEIEAIFCQGCGTQFAPAAPPAIGEKPGIAPAAPQPAAVVPVSEEPWTARDAWKCLGMFAVFAVVISLMWGAIQVQFSGFRHFSRSGAGHFVLSVVHYAVCILTMLYFARTESLRSFLKALGLTDSPSPYIWFAVVATLAIRVTGYCVISAGLSKGVTGTSVSGFAHSAGLERYLYLAPILLAPFAEELYMRGFFYRAFRGSYSVTASTLLILGITAVTHWNQFHRSWIAVVDIGALTVLQCFLRERTGNLWDCIISHLVFNVTGAFASLLVH
jgi:membrane protease YdiL (CAAX protease family)